MRRKLFVFILSLLCAMCLIFGLSACGSNNDTEKESLNAETAIVPTDTLVFGFNVDREKLNKYFIDNGNRVSASSDEYIISNNLATISYNASTNQFIIQRQVTSNSTLENASYLYKYTCAMQIDLYSILSSAKFVGVYNYSALNMNNGNVAADYSANFKFTVKKFKSEHEICDFSEVTYTSGITSATNWTLANEYFEPKPTGQTIFEQFQPCINAVSNIFQVCSNVDFSSKYDTDAYSNIDFSKIEFNNISERVDGDKHSIFANNIPNNIIVEYVGNGQSEIGTHKVTANFKDAKGKLLHTLESNIEITDIFDVTVQYIYGNIVAVNGEMGFVVGEQKFKAKYNSNILDYCEFPKGFVWKDTSNEWQSFLKDNCEWSGYENQTFKVSVVPEYEGYVQILSDTNSSVNGAIIKFSSLKTVYQNNIQSAQLYGSENLVAFRPSEIKSIKFFNTAYIGSISGTYFTNLESIDLSDCIHLKSINDDEYNTTGFFNYCKSLTAVIAPELPNLKIIGNYFLANTNITNFNFDMSAVEEIGNNFLYNSLYGEEERTINIDLKSITSIKKTNFLGSKNYTNSPDINLYVYDYIVSNYLLDNDAHCNIYVSNQIDYFEKLFEAHPNVHFYLIQTD